MNKNFKNTKAYREYLKGPLDDINPMHTRGDDWAGSLYNNLAVYFHNDEEPPANFGVDE